MSSAKPLVQAACICENVLIEADNVPSLIRIVDTFHLKITREEKIPAKTAVDLTLFIALKSGDVVGQFELGLGLRDPEGKTGPSQTWAIVLNGGEHGANVRVKVAIATPKEGLYWFDVLWGDEPLTSIPLRLKYAPSRAESAEPSQTTG